MWVIPFDSWYMLYVMTQIKDPISSPTSLPWHSFFLVRRLWVNILRRDNIKGTYQKNTDVFVILQSHGQIDKARMINLIPPNSTTTVVIHLFLSHCTCHQHIHVNNTYLSDYYVCSECLQRQVLLTNPKHWPLTLCRWSYKTNQQEYTETCQRHIFEEIKLFDNGQPLLHMEYWTLEVLYNKGKPQIIKGDYDVSTFDLLGNPHE